MVSLPSDDMDLAAFGLDGGSPHPPQSFNGDLISLGVPESPGKSLETFVPSSAATDIEFYSSSASDNAYAYSSRQVPELTGHPIPPYPQQNPSFGGECPPQAGACPQPAESSKCWTLGYYQQYFNVDTDVVITRIRNSMIPWSVADFLASRQYSWRAPSHVPAGPVPELVELVEPTSEVSRNNTEPDMYGPFWLATTLWILLAVAGTLAESSLFAQQSTIQPNQDAIDHLWQEVRGPFALSFTCMCAMYTFNTVIPLLLWAFSFWQCAPFGLVELMSLYGYASTPFLGAALICILPISWIRLGILMMAGAISAAYILGNTYGCLKAHLCNHYFIGVSVFIVLAQIGLGVGLRYAIFITEL